jgi:hypothetical protein
MKREMAAYARPTQLGSQSVPTTTGFKKQQVYLQGQTNAEGALMVNKIAYKCGRTGIAGIW